MAEGIQPTRQLGGERTPAEKADPGEVPRGLGGGGARHGAETECKDHEKAHRAAPQGPCLTLVAGIASMRGTHSALYDLASTAAHAAGGSAPQLVTGSLGTGLLALCLLPRCGATARYAFYGSRGMISFLKRSSVLMTLSCARLPMWNMPMKCPAPT